MTPKQLEQIDGRLKVVEQHLGIRAKSGRLSKIYEWANQNGLVLCLIGAIVGSGFTYWLEHRNDAWNRAVDGRVNQILGVEGGVTKTRATVQQAVATDDATLRTLAPFIQDVVRHQFENASKLSTGTLRERLPAVRDLIAVARNQRVKIEPTLTTSLSEKLLRIKPESANLWDVAGALISYRSFNSTSWTPEPNLANCTDSIPAITTMTVPFTVEGEKHELKRMNGEYHNCRVTLDSPEDGAHLNTLLSGGLAFIGFYRCIVVYHGGPIKFVLSWDRHLVDSVQAYKGTVNMSVSGDSLAFSDCLFDFSIEQSQPPPEVQQLTKLLLAQNTPTLTLPFTAR